MLARSEVQASIIHPKYICDGCDANPITGIRYKCSVCHIYDLCGKCEAAGIHKEHPMLKIRKPDQAPNNFNCQYKNAAIPNYDDLMAKY